MRDEAMARWPRFELVKFAEPRGIPNGWDAELIEKGAPKGLMGRYRAAKKLMLVRDTEDRQFVNFGRTMLTDHVCLDPRTGRVVEVIRHRRPPNTSYIALKPAQLVNSSLDQFTASVQAVIGRFPFDGGDVVRKLDQTDAESDEEWRLIQVAIDDMKSLLLDIDPVSSEIDGFWSTFLDDVGIGDFFTMDVLSDAPTTIGVIHPDGRKEKKVVKLEWDGGVW